MMIFDALHRYLAPRHFLYSRNGGKYLNKWSKKVRLRDGKCLKCGSKKDLEAHHIYAKTHYPQLAFKLNNGATLCKYCHRLDNDSYHGANGHKGNLKMFMRWL